MRHMKARSAAQHLNGGLEQHNSRGSVHVIIAVEQHRFLGGDCALDALDRGRHALHQEWVVEMVEIGIEKREGSGGIGYAAGDQQFRKYLRETRICCQRGSGFKVRFLQNPALRRQLARHSDACL
jgi:hypothetical protein